MKKTTDRKEKRWVSILLNIFILFSFIRLFSFCYSYGFETSMEFGIEGVVKALFGGLL